MKTDARRAGWGRVVGPLGALRNDHGPKLENKSKRAQEREKEDDIKTEFKKLPLSLFFFVLVESRYQKKVFMHTRKVLERGRERGRLCTPQTSRFLRGKQVTGLPSESQTVKVSSAGVADFG